MTAPSQTTPRPTSAPAGAERSRPRRLFALAVNETMAPLPMVAIQSTGVLLHGQRPLAAFALWWAVAAAFGTALPMVYLLRGVRLGHWIDHHVPKREHRVAPMVVTLISLLAGAAVMAAAGAPSLLTESFTATAVMLGVLIAVTFGWKISVHVAVVSGASVVLVVAFGLPALPALLLAPLSAWARLEARAHTLAQTTAGAAVGLLVPAVFYTVIGAR